MPVMLDRYRAQYQAAQDRYRAIEAVLAEADRDPSEVERGELDALTQTMTALQPQITGAVELERSMAASVSAMDSVPVGVPATSRTTPRTPAAPHPAEAFRSWGEWAGAVARGEIEPATREAVLEGGLDYMIEHARALVDMTTADVAGILPPTWIKTIADTISTAQPFVEAFSQLPLPDTGMTLTYPRIVTRPLVGLQTAEKTEIPSRKSSITAANATVATYGGGEDVSVQVLQRTDPAYLGLMLDLYAEAMAIVTNTDAITAALAAVPAPIVMLGTTGATYNKQLAAAATNVLQASRVMADTFVVGTDIWEAFAGASDTDGRPLFPNVSPVNPVGNTSLDSTQGGARGLNMVVDPMMPANKGILGARNAFTSLLGAVQTLSADNVSRLGRDYAVFRFAAFIIRRPDAMVTVQLGAVV